LAPPKNFLGGLEEKDRGARNLATPRRQHLGQRDRDRGVPVVAARVHDARLRRPERQIERLGEG
jgi:hypothetical protein